jgi:nucleotide-binding universal stress UspA family protein
MKPLTHILAATDFSIASMHAIDRAVILSERLNATLRLLHVREPGVIDSLRRFIGETQMHSLEEIDHQLERDLDDHLAQRHPRSRQIPRLRRLNGAVVQTILNEADAQNADLIVVGAQGESQMHHSPMGSIASRLLRKSPRFPVLVVKQPPITHYQRIIIGIDFSPVSFSLVKLARCMAPEADLILLHAFELPYKEKLSIAGLSQEDIQHVIPQEEAFQRQRMNDFIRDAELDNTPLTRIVVNAPPARAFIECSQRHDCDLALVGKHGTSIMEALLIGSVTKHLLNELNHDILVMMDKRLPAA